VPFHPSADRHLQPWLGPALAVLVPHMHTRLTAGWASLQAPAGEAPPPALAVAPPALSAPLPKRPLGRCFGSRQAHAALHMPRCRHASQVPARRRMPPLPMKSSRTACCGNSHRSTPRCSESWPPARWAVQPATQPAAVPAVLLVVPPEARRSWSGCWRLMPPRGLARRRRPWRGCTGGTTARTALPCWHARWWAWRRATPASTRLWAARCCAPPSPAWAQR
jgi:hypothetical protein